MKQSFNIVQQLSADFATNEKAYLAQSYSESQVRQDFIDKFFTALGWDVTHSVQKNPYEQEVKIENRVTMADSQRRADYAFSIAPNFDQVKFFVEAKKPSRSLANADDYFQTIRYAWNTRIPIAVLTDFEEFHILDCRHKPNIKTALDRRIAEFRYTDYQNEESFAKIFHLFGREAVAAGSLEKYAASLPKKGKKIPGAVQLVDDAFLEELDSYRELLAKAFKKTNEELQGDELTEAVQRTIDRLVFIRFLEDKGIEDKQIVTISDPKYAWTTFVNLCKRLQPKYNGLVFKSHRILDSGEFKAPDGAPFTGICQKIADPASPYDFNQIPISILGSIYERFLGKVVHATDKRVKVEEKPEVRKAGGVYYTPEYIVKYIVKETVGKLIDGKTPEQIAPMAFGDIACGSGSFLIEVYSQVLNYHLQYYADHPEAVGKDVLFERNGVKYLTLRKKKEILLNNVYGVDIDFQATEVTQLSLYLKMLENATMNDAHQFGLFKETILPDLRQNIICGNSLIGRDILEGDLFSTIDESKLKPINYDDAFPKIMKRGGFDAVVGNPPYVRSINVKENNIDVWNIIRRTYKSASVKEWDLYLVFVEKALGVLKSQGVLGFILPNKFLNSQVGESLRKHLAGQKVLKSLINFGAFQIFPEVTTYTCLLFLENNVVEQSDIYRFAGEVNKSNNRCLLPEESTVLWKHSVISNKDLSEQPWEFIQAEGGFINKLRKHLPLEKYARVFQGTGTRADKVFMLEARSEKGNNILVFSQETGKEHLIEKIYLKHALRGKSVSGYRIVENNMILLVPYKQASNKFVLVTEKEMQDTAPLTYNYLKECKGRLIERENGRFKGSDWFCFGRPQNMNMFDVDEKLVLPDISNGSNFTLDKDQLWLLDTIYGVVKNDNVDFHINYLLGILNSSVLTAYLKETGTFLRGGYFRVKTGYINPFPIPSIDKSNKEKMIKHDIIVKLVDQILDSKSKLATAKTESEIDRLELLCASLNRKIDEAVYDLYDLTKEEVAIVEGSL
jgi:type I restriction-modification system DNA methylase subunit